MKQRKMEQLCFERGINYPYLLIDFIKKITEKKEVTYQHFEFDISEEEFYKWIDRFKSGNLIRRMSQTEKKKFISVIISKLDEDY